MCNCMPDTTSELCDNVNEYSFPQSSPKLIVGRTHTRLCFRLVSSATLLFRAINS